MKKPLIERVWGPAGARLLAGDLLVIVLLLAGVLALPGARAVGRGKSAEVRSAAGAVSRLDLSRDGVTEVPGPRGTTRLEVRAGRVRVLSSPCPSQACRHGGWIGAPGEALVCLPNSVVVRIPGSLAPGTDAVAR